MSDFDNASYSANGGGPDNARAEVRSMPFFPAPPGTPSGPPSGAGAPAMPLGAPTPAQSAPPQPAPAQPVPAQPPGAPNPAQPGGPAQPGAGQPGPAQQGPSGRHSQTDEPGVSVAKVPEGAPAEPRPEPGSAQAPAGPGPVVKGRIKIEDEVVEKIAALAALEVPGVAGLGGDVARAIETVRTRIGVGHQRGDQGVKARVKDTEVSLDVTVVVEYGSVVMEVAKTVKNNVARIVSVMLGMRVTEVNVTVDDVRMPDEPHPG